jgi:hypothetical protein
LTEGILFDEGGRYVNDCAVEHFDYGSCFGSGGKNVHDDNNQKSSDGTNECTSRDGTTGDWSGFALSEPHLPSLSSSLLGGSAVKFAKERLIGNTDSTLGRTGNALSFMDWMSTPGPGEGLKNLLSNRFGEWMKRKTEPITKINEGSDTCDDFDDDINEKMGASLHINVGKGDMADLFKMKSGGKYNPPIMEKAVPGRNQSGTLQSLGTRKGVSRSVIKHLSHVSFGGEKDSGSQNHDVQNDVESRSQEDKWEVSNFARTL